MIDENRTDTYVEADHSINVGEQEQVEAVKKGFNQFIDSHMLLYSRIMEIEVDEELSFSEPGLISRFKDLFRSTDDRVYTGYQRIHEFVLKAEHVSGVDKARIAEALMFTGLGEDRSNLFESLADQLEVQQTGADNVLEIEEEK